MARNTASLKLIRRERQNFVLHGDQDTSGATFLKNVSTTKPCSIVRFLVVRFLKTLNFFTKVCVCVSLLKSYEHDPKGVQQMFFVRRLFFFPATSCLGVVPACVSPVHIFISMLLTGTIIPTVHDGGRDAFIALNEKF